MSGACTRRASTVGALNIYAHVPRCLQDTLQHNTCVRADEDEDKQCRSRTRI